MKNYLILLMLAGQTLVATAQDSKSLYLSKSLANEAVSNISVKTSAGAIVVSGSPGQAPRIDVYIKGLDGAGLSKQEIKKRLDNDYTFTVAVSGHDVNVTARSKRQGKNGLNISFKIYVPQQCSANLETGGGSIGLDHLKGNQRMETSGGGLQLDRLYGTIRGTTSGGGIHISNSNNDIELETSGGGIEAKNCSGKIRLSTSGGGLQLENLNGNIDAQGSGGDVNGLNISGELVISTSGGSISLKRISGNVDASTSSGSLFAGIIQAGKYLKLSASAGGINVELPAKQGYELDLQGQNVSMSSFTGFKGQHQKGIVKGKLNNGSIPVTADASGGNVSIKFN